MASQTPVRLYVGFGGTGAKTLLAFVENLAHHGEWGEASDTHFAFILVDTDRGDMEKYGSKIRDVCRRIGRDPIIKTCRTSEGVPSFQHHVARVFEAANHDPRLKDFWWYDAHGPFTAERMAASPEEGAGQCPLVSTFLAWKNLDKMGETVKEAVEQLQRRVTLMGGRQDWQLQTTFITGLAGGTGRGCWHLLSAKIRQVLKEIDLETLPVGYFFDSSVFSEIMNRDSGQALKMTVNGLTGFSEVIGWMRNEFEPDPFNFALPNIDRPRDTGADLIDVKRIITAPNGTVLKRVPGQSPITQAWFVFGAGKAGRPGNPEHYYRIVANAMYARLVSEIASGANNRGAVGGIGAASIYIPINDLKEYVSQYVSKFLPEMLAKSVDITAVDRWQDLLTDSLKAPSPFTYAPKSDGALIEQIIAGIKASQAQRLKLLAESIDKKDYRKTEAECRRLEGWANSPEGKTIIKQITERHLTAHFWGNQASPAVAGTAGLLRDLSAISNLSEKEFFQIYGGDKEVKQVNPVSSAFQRLVMRSELKWAKPDGTFERIDLKGYGTKASLARKLADRLADLASKVPGAPGATGEPSLTELFTKARRGLFQGGIDVNEAGMMNERAESIVRKNCMGEVQKVLKTTINQAVDELKRVASDMEMIVLHLLECANRTRKEVETKRQDLFWNDQDFMSVLSSQAENVFRGNLLAEDRLQPVENDASLEKELTAMAESASNQRFEDGCGQFNNDLRNWILAASSDADQAERKRELRRMIDKKITELSKELVLPSQFYVENFGFFAVVRNLLVTWGKEFAKRAAVEGDMVKLKRRFKVQFGCDYKMDRDGVVQLRDEALDLRTKEVCEFMAVGLANRCDVLFEGKREAGPVGDDKVEIVLPSEECFSAEFSEKVKQLADQVGLFVKPGSLTVISTYKMDAMNNPFLMLGYAQEAFAGWAKGDLANLASLNYWKQPETTRWLEACEDENGKSVFTHDNEVLPNSESSFGLGYVCRAFVTNEQLRNSRWRPWAKYGATQANAEQDFLLDVLAYSLLDEPSTDNGALLGVNEKEQWNMPLINLRGADNQKEGQAKKFEYSRCAFRVYIGRRSADAPAFKAGDGYTSIKKTLDAFAGKDNPLIKTIAEEAALYLKEILPAHGEDGVDANGALKSMFRELISRLQLIMDAETGPTQAEYQKLFARLIRRCESLSAMTCQQLQGHFDRLGRV